MTRTTSMLLLLVLALGVFIYFNPAARQQAGEAWQNARTILVDLYVKGFASIKDLFSGGQGASTQQRSTGSGSTGASPGLSINTGAFLNSLRALWLDISARLNSS